jgi:hypothetical protein
MALTKVTSGVRTIAASEITTAAIADDAVTLAKLAHGTDGNLITYDASGAPAAVATGTAGHVLTSAGAGAVPSFAAYQSYVIQTAQVVDVTNRSVAASATYATTGISLALGSALKSTASKVRINVTANVGQTNGVQYVEFTLYDGAAFLTPSGVTSMSAIAMSNANVVAPYMLMPTSIDFITSPGATAAKTYTLYWRVSLGTGYLGRRAQDTAVDTVSATITLTELN